MSKMSDQLQPALDTISDKIWNRFCQLYPAMKKFPKPVVVFNNRLKSCAGRNYSEDNRIEISTKLFVENTDKFISDTIPHEIAHQIDYNINKDKWNTIAGVIRHHGKTWKEIMITYGLVPSIYHDYVINK